MTRLFVIATALASLQTPVTQAGGQETGTLDGSTPPPSGRLTVQVERAAGPIELDAQLGDAGWRGVTRLTGFTEFNPGNMVKPPVRTEAMITYDDYNLYVAFIAYDDPARIRASLQERDRVFSDDNVGVVIDTYGDATNGYFLLANPLGVQADLRFTIQGEDDSFDVIYDAEGRITEDGYIVEMAIPFASLRFPDAPTQVWTINLYRNYPRSQRHQITWAPLDTDDPCILCQSALLTGIAGIEPGGSLELLPSLVASQAGSRPDAGARFENQDPSASVSLGAKYAFQNGWTVEATANPDFSQVESDAAQIDVNTTFALFFDERRPFFQEGSDLFSTYISQVYTRSVNNPVAAAKLTGRLGDRTRVAYLGAVDETTPFILPFEESSAFAAAGQSVSNVLRVKHELGEGAHVGTLITDRRLKGGGSGSTVSLDVLYRFGTSHSIEAQLVTSYTVEPEDAQLSDDSGLDFTFGRGADTHTAAFDGESYRGRASFVSVERNARHWSWDLEYWDATPTYRADAGFQSNNDYRRAVGWTGLTLYPESELVSRVSFGASGGAVWNFGGEQKDFWIEPSFTINLPGQTYIYVEGIHSNETFRDLHFADIRRWGAEVGTNPLSWLSFGVWTAGGDAIARTADPAPLMGDLRVVSAWGTLKPLERLVVDLNFGYESLDTRSGADSYAGYVARTRASLQFTRELSLRLITQFNEFNDSWDFEPLVVWRLNPFSIFYLGSRMDYANDPTVGMVEMDRQFFLKFQYLFRM